MKQLTFQSLHNGTYYPDARMTEKEKKMLPDYLTVNK